MSILQSVFRSRSLKELRPRIFSGHKKQARSSTPSRWEYYESSFDVNHSLGFGPPTPTGSDSNYSRQSSLSTRELALTPTDLHPGPRFAPSRFDPGSTMTVDRRSSYKDANGNSLSNSRWSLAIKSPCKCNLNHLCLGLG